MQFPVIIELARSRLFLRFLTCTHALAALGICLAALPLWAKFTAALFLMASFIYAVRHYTERQPQSLWLYPQGDLGLVLPGSAPPPLPARLESAALVLPWLCVFAWRYDTNVPFAVTADTPKRGVLVLLPDSADAQNLRRLRLWLRWTERVDSGSH
ncbi:hypothetical protein AGMMS50289_09800 [Betaproteobacteria bacterium]|nr:hypothetical protein AGMMS50289_09800 [Betaproteobacteria bacterium]